MGGRHGGCAQGGGPLGDDLGDGGLDGQDGGGGVGLLAGAADPKERDGLGCGQDPANDRGQFFERLAEQARRDVDDDVGGGEDLLRREAAFRAEHLPGDAQNLPFGERTGNLGLLSGEVDGGDQVGYGPADLGQFLVPAGHQLPDGGVALDVAGVAGGDVAGPVARIAPFCDGGVDLGGPFGVHVEYLVGNSGNAPVAESSRPAGVGSDVVTEFDRHPGSGHAADGSGGVELLAPHRGVGRLPAAEVVEHLDHVGQEDVVVRTGVPGPGGGVTGVGVDQPTRRRGDGQAAPPPAALPGDGLQIGQGGVPLGVHDPVHVLSPPDHSQFGHRLVGGDDQLHARPAGGGQPGARPRVLGAARAVDRRVLLLGHAAGETEVNGPRPAPDERSLTPGGVVGEGLAGMVVGPAHDRRLVVGDRVRTHHPHPRHGPTPSNRTVAIVSSLFGILALSDRVVKSYFVELVLMDIGG